MRASKSKVGTGGNERGSDDGGRMLQNVDGDQSTKGGNALVGKGYTERLLKATDGGQARVGSLPSKQNLLQDLFSGRGTS